MKKYISLVMALCASGMLNANILDMGNPKVGAVVDVMEFRLVSSKTAVSILTRAQWKNIVEKKSSFSNIDKEVIANDGKGTEVKLCIFGGYTTMVIISVPDTFPFNSGDAPKALLKKAALKEPTVAYPQRYPMGVRWNISGKEKIRHIDIMKNLAKSGSTIYVDFTCSQDHKTEGCYTKAECLALDRKDRARDIKELNEALKIK